MNKYLNVALQMLKVIFGIVIGYCIYYFVLMDIVAIYLCWTEAFYITVSLITLFLSIVGSTFVIFMITGTKVSPLVYKVVSITYLVLLVLAFFGRRSLSREFDVNVIASVQALFTDKEYLLQTVLNTLILMPLAYFFRKKSILTAELSFLGIAVGIELLQYISIRGFFDLWDIICYMIGMTLAYLFFHILKIDLVKETEAKKEIKEEVKEK